MDRVSKTTSWGAVANWYDEHLDKPDTYHETVIAPNLLRFSKIKQGEKVLDIGCGQGFFAKKISEIGATVTGADIAPELIEIARTSSPTSTFFVSEANDLSFAKRGSFDVVISVLAIQNIRDLRGTIAECARVMSENGRMYLVINHPAFRIPERSSWQYDSKKNIQYRRLDGYMSDKESELVMNPGGKKSVKTISFHRPLQVYVKALASAGLAITGMEEWISNRTSDSGPRANAENTARKEFPLFMALEIHKIQKR